jgi:hypothetical protein
LADTKGQFEKNKQGVVDFLLEQVVEVRSSSHQLPSPPIFSPLLFPEAFFFILLFLLFYHHRVGQARASSQFQQGTRQGLMVIPIDFPSIEAFRTSFSIASHPICNAKNVLVYSKPQAT